jgi:hypothetical protein
MGRDSSADIISTTVSMVGFANTNNLAPENEVREIIHALLYGKYSDDPDFKAYVEMADGQIDIAAALMFFGNDILERLRDRYDNIVKQKAGAVLYIPLNERAVK